MQRGNLVRPHVAGERDSLFFYFSQPSHAMNATDLAQNGDALTSPIHTVISDDPLCRDETIEQWTRLVRQYYPNLAVPIARAMAQRAAQGPYGDAMQSIAKGLAYFDERAILELTGSELQMLSALLLNLREQAQRLLQQVNAQWSEE